MQRELEKAGIATVSVSLIPSITRKMGVPRALLPGFPLGHPFGMPGRRAQRRAVLEAALDILESAREPGTVVERTFA